MEGFFGRIVMGNSIEDNTEQRRRLGKAFSMLIVGMAKSLLGYASSAREPLDYSTKDVILLVLEQVEHTLPVRVLCVAEEG